MAALEDRSRRPRASPTRTDPAIEARIIAQRDRTGCGGRTLHHWLHHQGLIDPPAPSTITTILRRHDRHHHRPAAPSGPCRRRDHPQPTDLWQLDVMGHRPLVRGRVNPLTVLDDHARVELVLAACPHEQETLVRDHLTTGFARYGFPLAMLCDTGPPRGTSGAPGLTVLDAWLIRLGIRVIHERPRHPQTQGTRECWHRTIGPCLLPDLAADKTAVDRFRDRDTTERPHLGIGETVPVRRSRPRPRPLPERLPEIIPDDDAVVVTVHSTGGISVQHRRVFVSQGVAGHPVGIESATPDGRCRTRLSPGARHDGPLPAIVMGWSPCPGTPVYHVSAPYTWAGPYML